MIYNKNWGNKSWLQGRNCELRKRWTFLVSWNKYYRYLKNSVSASCYLEKNLYWWAYLQRDLVTSYKITIDVVEMPWMYKMIVSWLLVHVTPNEGLLHGVWRFHLERMDTFNNIRSCVCQTGLIRTDLTKLSVDACIIFIDWKVVNFIAQIILNDHKTETRWSYHLFS